MIMPDLHHEIHLPPASPACHLVNVVPSDEMIYDPPLRAIWLGGMGDITVLAEGDTEPVTLTTLPAGVIFDLVLIRQVLATGTSIKKIVGAF